MKRHYTKADGPIVKFIHESDDHRPSWQNHGKGFASIEFQSHTGHPYLSMCSREVSDKSSRATYITMDEHESLALYQWLKALHESVPQASQEPQSTRQSE